MKRNKQWMSVAVCLLVLAGCTGGAGDTLAGADGELDSTVQILKLEDADRNLYNLRYRADLTPEQAAAVLVVTLHDDTKGAVGLTPVTSRIVAKSEVPRTASMEVWPIEPATGKPGDVILPDPDPPEPPDRIRIRGATICEYNEYIEGDGESKEYRIHDAFATSGTMAPVNDAVNYDLELQRRGESVCSTYRPPGFSEHCMSYTPRVRNVRRWEYRVIRSNEEPGEYHMCMDYWWRQIH